MAIEYWAPIEELPNFEVSTFGRVANRDTGRILTNQVNQNGFVQVVMTYGGKPYCRAVHKLMALAFLGDPPMGYVPVHRDENRQNNIIDNIEWIPLSTANRLTRQRKQQVASVKKEVICLENGETWPDTLEAAKDLRIIESDLILAINLRIQHKGMTFDYVQL